MTDPGSLIRLLLIDDHPLVRDGMRMHLALQPGLRVVGEADDGEAALAWLDRAGAAELPDLVITDIQLPFISGIELMELLRADEELKDVPIMAVTAYSAPGDDERIRAAGAQAYVSKPISVMRFAETVDQLLAGGVVEGSGQT